MRPTGRMPLPKCPIYLGGGSQGCGGLVPLAPHLLVSTVRNIFVLSLKLLQSAKLRKITAALEADGFIGLDAQATALGLSRSTAWTILSGSHKASGLSARTLNRMLAAPLLGERARAKILEYIAEKRAGHYGTSKSALRRFDQRWEACPPSPPTRDEFQMSFENRGV
jgi:hypothetical protein